MFLRCYHREAPLKGKRLGGAKIHEIPILVRGLRIGIWEFLQPIGLICSYILTPLAASNSKSRHQKLTNIIFWSKIDVFEVLSQGGSTEGKTPWRMRKTMKFQFWFVVYELESGNFSNRLDVYVAIF